MILIDTSEWIDYFNGQKNKRTDKLDEFLLSEQVIMGDILLAETLQGFRKMGISKKQKRCSTI